MLARRAAFILIVSMAYFGLAGAPRESRIERRALPPPSLGVSSLDLGRLQSQAALFSGPCDRPFVWRKLRDTCAARWMTSAAQRRLSLLIATRPVLYRVGRFSPWLSLGSLSWLSL